MKIQINKDGTVDSEGLKKLIREVLVEMGIISKEPVDKASSTNETISKEADKVAPGSIVIKDGVQNWDKMIKSGEEIIRLPESWADKEISIFSEGMIRPGKTKVIVGDNTILTFVDWGKAPTQLFDLKGCEELGIRGCTFVCPPDRPIQTAFPDKEIFGWERDSVTKGRFAYIDGQEIKDKDRVTYGLARFCYSSKSTERIYLIAENIWHNGFNFTQIKNPEQGNLWLILKNVNIHNPIIELPRSHYYSPTRFKVRVSVQDGIARIISENTFDQILTHWGYNFGPQRSILHFDRYVFDISEANLMDNKSLKLFDSRAKFERISSRSIRTNYELHPLDRTNLGIVLTKQIDDSRRYNWIYEFDRESEEKEIELLNSEKIEGEFDAYIVNKGSAFFSIPVTKDTKFGPDYWESGVVTLSNGYGWTWYNQEFSGYIEGYHGTGYHRNSGGSGIIQELTIKDSTFEDNPPNPNSNHPMMPKEASDFIKYLRSV